MDFQKQVGMFEVVIRAIGRYGDDCLIHVLFQSRKVGA